jgi:hypothetical protein
MWGMQYNVEFGYQPSICSRTVENHGKPWSSWPVAGPSECKLTSGKLSGIKYANLNDGPYLAAAIFKKKYTFVSTDLFMCILWMSSKQLCITLTGSESESESYVTTDGQSASLSWNKAPIWGLRPDFYYCETARVCWRGALSLTRGQVCRLHLLLVLASAVILGTRDHILVSHIWDFPFRRLLRLAGSRWRYSIPPPHGDELGLLNCLPYNHFASTEQKTPFPTVSLLFPRERVHRSVCLETGCIIPLFIRQLHSYGCTCYNIKMYFMCKTDCEDMRDWTCWILGKLKRFCYQRRRTLHKDTSSDSNRRSCRLRPTNIRRHAAKFYLPDLDFQFQAFSKQINARHEKPRQHRVLPIPHPERGRWMNRRHGFLPNMTVWSVSPTNSISC